MSAAPVSVIIVSRGRPGLLRRCLTGVGQLCYPNYEIVVVADRAGADAVRDMGWEARLKLVGFDAANISAARNAGLAVAAGEIVAFIDDDAVPEPTWLNHLAAPFGDASVTQSGGYVIGRNGIRFQWTARAVNVLGQKLALDHVGDAPFEPTPPTGYVAKTEGTNAGFRRETLAGIGGFDPAFRFFLDETDVNLRMAAAGGRGVMVPLARVHHGYAGSAQRGADRAPTDLLEIGASSVVFWRKHCGIDTDLAPARQALIAEQRARLLHYMVIGGLEPRDVARLLGGLEDGLVEGKTRALAPLAPIGAATQPFCRFERGPVTGVSRRIAGRVWQRAAMRQAAARHVAHGDIVTLLRFSPTALPHHVRFHDGGWWEHWGGLFGRSADSDPYLRPIGFRARAAREWARVAKLRQCENAS